MAGGRPTVYTSENAEIARHACMLGASNETLAERFEVSRRTIDNWIATITEFGDYEQVNGVYLPFAWEQWQKGSTDHQKVQYDKAEANVTASDGTFAFPVPHPGAATSK